jgi:alkylhydroperoxidase family enzyme
VVRTASKVRWIKRSSIVVFIVAVATLVGCKIRVTGGGSRYYAAPAQGEAFDYQTQVATFRVSRRYARLQDLPATLSRFRAKLIEGLDSAGLVPRPGEGKKNPDGSKKPRLRISGTFTRLSTYSASAVVTVIDTFDQRALATFNVSASRKRAVYGYAGALTILKHKIVSALATKAQSVNKQIASLDGWRKRFGLPARITAKSLPALLRATADPDAGIRGRALALIATLGSRARSAVRAIAALLTDPSAAVRALALRALAAIDSPEPWLVTTLERLGARDREVGGQMRRVAISWRVRLYAHAANPTEKPLFLAIGKNDPQARVSALQKLATLERISPAAHQLLVVMLGISDEASLAVALQALVRFGHYSYQLDRQLGRFGRHSRHSPRIKQLAAQARSRIRARYEIARSSSSHKRLAAIPMRATMGGPRMMRKREILVVFPFKASPLSQPDTRTLGTYLSTQLAAVGFRVVPRSQLRRALKTKKRASYKNCFDEACQIELGRALAAQKAISPNLVRSGRHCTLMLTLYDLKTETTDGAATQTASCNVQSLMRAVKRAAGSI